MRVRARRDVREAGLELREGQVLEDLERADRVELQPRGKHRIELGDVGDIVDPARGIDIERLDLDARRAQVVAKDPGARPDLEHGLGPHREHGAELVPVRHPALGVVVALEVVVLRRDLDVPIGHRSAAVPALMRAAR